MMEPVSFGVGAVVLAIGLACGWATKKTKRPDPPSAICGCKHNLGSHEKKGSDYGSCQAQIKRASQWTYGGRPYSWEYVNCSCMRYDGPVLLQDVINGFSSP